MTAKVSAARDRERGREEKKRGREAEEEGYLLQERGKGRENE